jgi:formate hydrogenlyase transcriptional activator
MVQERKFRADLYFRLNVFPITLPPLRDRRDDISLLVKHFVQNFAKRQGKLIDCIPEDVMEELISHDWPGNIRELQNVIECAVILTSDRVLRLHSGKLRRQNPESAPSRTLDGAKRAHILATLRETNWVIGGRRGAAALLGLPRTTLITMMRRYGIAREDPGWLDAQTDRSIRNQYRTTSLPVFQ